MAWVGSSEELTVGVGVWVEGAGALAFGTEVMAAAARGAVLAQAARNSSAIRAENSNWMGWER